jgi:hypothetical protein
MRTALVVLLAICLSASATASDVMGTFGAKVVWKDKTPPTTSQKIHIQQIEKKMRLFLYPDARYMIEDGTQSIKGRWHVANGYFILSGIETPGKKPPLVAYKFSKDGKTLTPKLKEGQSYIIFVKKDGKLPRRK